MSRSGYTEDFDGEEWGIVRWRGTVANAMKGKRSQVFFRDLLDALEAMPVKRFSQIKA